MRNLLIAACCAALLGSVSIASAQNTAPAAQDSMKTDSPMNANAKMKKSSKKTTKSKSGDSMKSDAPKDDMKKDAKWPSANPNDSRDAFGVSRSFLSGH